MRGMVQFWRENGGKQGTMEGPVMEVEAACVSQEKKGEEGGMGEGGEGENEVVVEKEVGESVSQAADEGEPSSQPEKLIDSRYLENDDNKKKAVQPTSRRMTRAERARQEALASFGGTDLASVSVKKRDLREELQRDVALMEQGESRQNRVKPRARVQNSSDGVKDVLFGERAVSRKRKLEVSSGVVGSGPREPKATRHMTKAERARLDALQSFGGCGFDDVLATSRKRIAKTFEMKTETKKGEGEEEEGGEGERVMEEVEEKEEGERVGEEKGEVMVGEEKGEMVEEKENTEANLAAIET